MLIHKPCEITFFENLSLKICNYQKNFLTLQLTQLVREGERVKTLWKKDVYGRYLQSLKSRKFESSSEETQPKRPRWVYCILLQYLTTWANSSCLS